MPKYLIDTDNAKIYEGARAVKSKEWTPDTDSAWELNECIDEWMIRQFDGYATNAQLKARGLKPRDEESSGGEGGKKAAKKKTSKAAKTSGKKSSKKASSTKTSGKSSGKATAKKKTAKRGPKRQARRAS